METLVMKFGGASVATPAHFSRIADIILSKQQSYSRLVIVVSAMGNTTNQLISLAKHVHPDPPRREYDMLVTVGERISISLLAMSLAKRNQEAVSFTGSQSGIITSTDHSDAKIIEIRPHRIIKNLEQGKVVIVAGFQGVSSEGEITTLGRGGSDTSAVALGIALGAEIVEFYKDVNGIYARDPKKDPNAELFKELTYEQALQITQQDPGVLHPRCLMLAQKNHLPLLIRSFLFDVSRKQPGTIIRVPDGKRLSFPLYELAKEGVSKNPIG